MKTKNKKSNLAEIFANRRNKSTAKKSPFEMHINRAKQDVLGRKSKTDRGLPGVSRSKAIIKRKQTLFQEFKTRNKDNLFYDKRIGEKSHSMTEEEKTMRRYVAEQVARHKKKSIFNLNDEEILTHRGQSLMDIEKYDDPRSDDEDDEETGRLNRDFVEEAHFGGGLLEKKQEKSHKDLIETLILESKKRKAEKKKMKEEAIDLTEKLDAQWKDLLPLVTASQKTDADKEREKGKVDEYDKLVRQMKYDRRAVAGEKLKSKEEKDKEEREKIERMEKERLLRMEDEEREKREGKYKSADDLDDDYFVEKVEEGNSDLDVKREDDDDNNDDNDGDEEEDDDVDEEETDKESEKESIKSKDEEKTKNEDNEDEDSSDDDMSDLKASSSDEEEEAEEETYVHKKVVPGDKEETDDDKKNLINNEEKKEIASLENSTVSMIEIKTTETLKYNKLKKTYKIASNLMELEETLKKFSWKEKSEVVSRMIKGKEKSPEYKTQCIQLFDYLLQYLEKYINVETKVEETFDVCNMISPHLYDLAHLNPEETTTIFKNLIKLKYEKFEKDLKKYPKLDTIILFKIASLIYPSSDFRHPVMTPCHIFMNQILFKCQPKTKSDLAKGLFICTLFLENTILSKRFVPSVINYLRGILCLSQKKYESCVIPRAIPPFKNFGPEETFLVLEKSLKQTTPNLKSLKMQIWDLVENELDDNFKLRLMFATVILTKEFTDILQDLEAGYVLFQPIMEILNSEILNDYPMEVQNIGQEIKKNLEKIMDKNLEYLVLPKKKPKALKLYQPQIEPVYEGKRNRPKSKELAERQKLQHKLKMETKNAKREIRRDNTFLAKVRIQEQIKNDEERKRKVKELFAGAAIQQSELKKMKKK